MKTYNIIITVSLDNRKRLCAFIKKEFGITPKYRKATDAKCLIFIDSVSKEESDIMINHIIQCNNYVCLFDIIRTEQQPIKTKNMRAINFTDVNCDIYGNPRTVCHFLNFITDKENALSIDEKYKIAAKRAKQIGGKKYRGKEYGGGFVFQAWSKTELEKKINNLLDSL